MKPREIAVLTVLSNLNAPYYWGGDDPLHGFDCSGLMIEGLKSSGVLPRDGDWTADALYYYPDFKVVKDPYEGCLVFWFNADKSRISHVEMCLDDVFAIGASGGSNKTITLSEAIRQNAYVKIRPFRSRQGIAGFRDPFKEVD